MQTVSVLYGRGSQALQIPDGVAFQIIEPIGTATSESVEKTVQDALDNPIGSAGIRELTRTAHKILIITNDNTRPMPSRLTIPALIKNFYLAEARYDITILIATGLHRMMTELEIREQLGEELVAKYRVVVHSAIDREGLVSFGFLPSGEELFLNRLVAENDLVIAEGFIEPHFFAGFSGGRKSILPGVAGAVNILSNHRPANIAHPRSTQAVLNGNPIHEECLAAARMARLQFILNVALNRNKQVVAAFAGDVEAAHLAGCKYVEERMTVDVRAADIVVTSNHGYPLDRNLYQAVKGIDTAAKALRKGGVIIVAAECIDGVGHEFFKQHLLSCGSVKELLAKMSAPPSEIDKWQTQILARVLVNHTVILVSAGIERELAERMFFTYATDLDEALDMALSITGRDALVSVMPEGPVVIPRIQ